MSKKNIHFGQIFLWCIPLFHLQTLWKCLNTIVFYKISESRDSILFLFYVTSNPWYQYGIHVGLLKISIFLSFDFCHDITRCDIKQLSLIVIPSQIVNHSFCSCRITSLIFFAAICDPFQYCNTSSIASDKFICVTSVLFCTISFNFVKNETVIWSFDINPLITNTFVTQWH